MPQKKGKKNLGGRPIVLTPEVVSKLEMAFSIDSTVTEACAFAEISRESFYRHLKINPTFSDRIEQLRQKPMLKARNVIIGALDDPDTAKWYAERKAKNEFSTRQELAAPGGSPLLEPDPETKKKIDKIFKANMR